MFWKTFTSMNCHCERKITTKWRKTCFWAFYTISLHYLIWKTFPVIHKKAFICLKTPKQLIKFTLGRVKKHHNQDFQEILDVMFFGFFQFFFIFICVFGLKKRHKLVTSAVFFLKLWWWIIHSKKNSLKLQFFFSMRLFLKVKNYSLIIIFQLKKNTDNLRYF